LIAVHTQTIQLDTAGQTFHTLTVVEGTAHVDGANGRHQLVRLATIVIPSAAGPYTIQPLTPCHLLKASVEHIAAHLPTPH
jgi:hypothetical protein